MLLLEGVDGTADLPGLVRLQRALERESGIATAIGPATPAARDIPGFVLAENDAAARYLLVLDDEPQGGPAVDTVERLRERLPALTEEAGLSGVEVRLAGDTALAGETVETITHDLIRIGIAAFLVNFILLAIFLRALIAPLYLVLASALALAASIGLTTLFFQGFLGHDEITYHVPFAVAVLLLSLGSDYNVFVVGRIWQSRGGRPIAARGDRDRRPACLAGDRRRGPRARALFRGAGADRPAAVPRVRVRDVRGRPARRIPRSRPPDPGIDLPLRRAQLLASQADAGRAGHGHRCRLDREKSPSITRCN